MYGSFLIIKSAPKSHRTLKKHSKNSGDTFVDNKSHILYKHRHGLLMILRFKKYVSLIFFMHIIHEKKKFNDNFWFIKTYKNDRSTKEKTT